MGAREGKCEPGALFPVQDSRPFVPSKMTAHDPSPKKEPVAGGLGMSDALTQMWCHTLASLTEHSFVHRSVGIRPLDGTFQFS